MLNVAHGEECGVLPPYVTAGVWTKIGRGSCACKFSAIFLMFLGE